MISTAKPEGILISFFVSTKNKWSVLTFFFIIFIRICVTVGCVFLRVLHPVDRIDECLLPPVAALKNDGVYVIRCLCFPLFSDEFWPEFLSDSGINRRECLCVGRECSSVHHREKERSDRWVKQPQQCVELDSGKDKVHKVGLCKAGKQSVDWYGKSNQYCLY